MRKRLTKTEALALGFNPREGNEHGNFQYSINEEQWNDVLEMREEYGAHGNTVSQIKVKTVTKTNGYKNKPKGLSALDPETGRIMSKEEFCKLHNIDSETIHSAKLVTHTGSPFYNIAFKKEESNIDFDWKSIEKKLESSLGELKFSKNKASYRKDKEGIVKIADIHLGAYIDRLIKTKDFNIDTVVDNFNTISREVNSFGYRKVHVHLMGDLIESFTGLNHKNSWKGLDKGMHGAEVVKLCVNIIHGLLSKINNLGEVKIIGGNHDRVTSDNKEDTKAGAADLIAWGLELIGYSVEFNSVVITHVVDNICHVLTHGHHGISKKTTKEIIWDYGKQGMFNFLSEAHLHSRIQKLSVTQAKNFQTISDDSVDCRRQVCPSIFTGNSFSEELGYTSTGGFLIIENNGKNKPNVFDFSL